MYDDLLLRLPNDEADLWEILRAQFEHVAVDFGRLQFETKEDALYNRFHATPNGIRRNHLNVIRYRDVSEELESREFFWEMGYRLVGEVEILLIQKRLSPTFIQQWGKLMFCHGYVMAHVFDDSDDLGHARGGKKSGEVRAKTLQHKWIGHLMYQLILDGRYRNSLEIDVVAYINRVIGNRNLRGNFNKEWFEALLDEERSELKPTYNEKNLGKKAVVAIGQEPIEGLPPLPLKLPWNT